ncbi:MAG: hypothetical protein WAM95_00410 [Bacillus sp. (in: firmicutes)]
MEKIFQLDKFLTIEYMKMLVQNNGFRMINQPPNELEQTLVYYKQLLNNALQAPYIMSEEENVQIKISVNQEEYYLMSWNIPKLKYLIKREKIQKTQIPVDLVKSFISQSNHNPTSNHLQNDDTEIIIVSYPPISSKYLIIKGKEQFEKIKNEKEKIESFILDPFVHLQATSSTVYRSLFAIHFNYSLLCSYIAGQLTIEEIEKRIFPVY